jgi:hypothetical protein
MTQTGNAREFPPFIDSYRWYENITLSTFKEELLDDILDSAEEVIGTLWLNKALDEDTNEIPIKIGWFIENHTDIYKKYAVIVKIKDVGFRKELDMDSAKVIEYDYPQEWNVT